jgi:hypothetical protein
MTSCTSCEAKNPMIECPNRMEDGRAFTDYRPRCAVNAELYNLVNKANMAKSSYESRMYLQQNADQFMLYEKNKAIDRSAPCAPCNAATPSTMLPERYVVRCNGVSCERHEVDPWGVGDGRNFNSN